MITLHRGNGATIRPIELLMGVPYEAPWPPVNGLRSALPPWPLQPC